MATQPSYRASGHTGKITDPKRVRWENILGAIQSNPGAFPKNNPAKTDTIRAIKVKILRAIHPPLNGGGGVGGPPSPGGGGGTDANVTEFISCSGITDATQISAVTQLVSDLKSNNLWNSFDAIYPFVGGTAGAHSCNLKDVQLYSITWHGGLTHDANGVTGNGTNGYGDTGFNPTSGSNNWSLSSACMGVYSRTPTFNNCSYIGAFTGLPNYSYIAAITQIVSHYIESLGLSGSVGNVLLETDFSQSIIVSRTSNTAQTTYSKSGSADSSNLVTSLTPQSFYVLAVNSSGTPGGFSPSNLAFAFIGGGLDGSQIATLKTIINTYQTTLGRNV